MKYILKFGAPKFRAVGMGMMAASGTLDDIINVLHKASYLLQISLKYFHSC